jgi:hypothetical protein
MICNPESTNTTRFGITLQKANAAIADIEGYNATRKEVSDATTDHRWSYWKRRLLYKKINLFKKREIGQPKSKKESTDGWDIAPRLQDKVVFSELRKEHHLDAIITELTKQEALPALMIMPTPRISGIESKLSGGGSGTYTSD